MKVRLPLRLQILLLVLKQLLRMHLKLLLHLMLLLLLQLSLLAQWRRVERLWDIRSVVLHLGIWKLVHVQALQAGTVPCPDTRMATARVLFAIRLMTGVLFTWPLVSP